LAEAELLCKTIIMKSFLFIYMILSLYAFFHFSFHSWSTELEGYCLLIPGGVAVHIFGIGEDSFEIEN